MGSRRLELNLLSAQNLENVRNIFRMKVYAVVSFPGSPDKKTPVDDEGGVNPSWNETVTFYNIPESDLAEPGRKMVVKLICKRSMGDRDVGEVEIELKHLFDAASDKGSAILSFPVVVNRSRSKGGGGGCEAMDEEEDESPRPSPAQSPSASRLLSTGKGVLNVWCKFGKAGEMQSPPDADMTNAAFAGLKEFLRVYLGSG